MEYQDYFAKKAQQLQPRQHQIPAFGNWDYYDDMPVTQYFESARQASLIRGSGAGTAPYGCGGHYYAADADLFHVPPSPMHRHYHHKTLKAPQKATHHNQQGNVTSSKEQRRQVRVCDADAAANATAYPRKKPKAVDEDLYKIPPELLRQRRPKKVAMGSFWRCCLGLDCIA